MTGYFTFLHCLQKNVLLFSFLLFLSLALRQLSRKWVYSYCQGERQMTRYSAYLQHSKKLFFPVSFSRHLFKIIVVSPLFSSSSCIRTRVSSASASTSTTAAPLLSTSLRRYSPSVSVQECFIIISTLSLMGVVDELKAGFRLPPLPPPPPPRPPLEQPIILSPSTPREVSFHRNRQIWKKNEMIVCLFPHWLFDWNGRCLNWGEPSMTYDHLLGCLRLGPVASSISEPMPIAARIPKWTFIPALSWPNAALLSVFEWVSNMG